MMLHSVILLSVFACKYFVSVLRPTVTGNTRTLHKNLIHSIASTTHISNLHICKLKQGNTLIISKKQYCIIHKLKCSNRKGDTQRFTYKTLLCDFIQFYKGTRFKKDGKINYRCICFFQGVEERVVYI